ncbi:archaellin/type IV pilin N-terminal domain-containing protein [Cuniculiplasma sp. SKW4]|uniref:archaellin/type IV pilin N-terminal domain-containing protein n=1 Tax=Cuniculiplasma sp. SKW4 TaxID=3400171 RepID=UPI003FD0F012
MKQVINKEDKAVSPIIATILLIAITVVLAATLVTILGGFTHGVSNTVETGSLNNLQVNTSDYKEINATVAASSQNLNNSQVSFTLVINNKYTFSGTLSESDIASSPSGYEISVSATSTLFTAGTVYHFSITGKNTLTISTYVLSLSYKGSQFYSSGTQTA